MSRHATPHPPRHADDWQTRIIQATLHPHWQQSDPERLRRPVFLVLGYACIAAILHGLLGRFANPAFWGATGAAVLAWLWLWWRKRPFSLIWLVIISIVSLPLITLAIIGTGKLAPFGLMLCAHAVFSGIFFRTRFRWLMYFGAFCCSAVGNWGLSDPVAWERTLGLIVVTAMSATVLHRVMHDLREQARQNRHLQLINSTVADLADSTDSTALDRLCETALSAFGAQECVLLERSPDGLKVRPIARAFTPGFEPFALMSEHERPAAEAGSLGRVASDGEAIISGNVLEDKRFIYPPDLPPAPISAMVVPVPHECGGVAGVFRILRRGLDQFRPDDFELCQLWAGEVGKLLEKRRLYTQLQVMATTDSLTGTYNRHYLNERWPGLVTQSQESGEPVTFLMLDCFNFKQINDRYGHMMGDEILRALGRILMDSVPSDGFAVRYGGDEFLIVLPGDLYETGLQLRTAIELDLARLRTRYPDWPAVIVDIGVYSAQGDALNSVLTRVDIALYDAKEEGYRARLAALLESSVGERARHMVQAVMTLTRIQELNDPYTRGHTERAKGMAMALAREMGLPEDQVEVIGFGAVLHDVGKIVVPPHILNKPGPLTDEEWAIMRMHPQFGANIVGELELLRGVHPIILHHHERFDGATVGRHPGYPAGLKGDEIPIGSRIVAVVDTFDAMTSDRIYRKGQSADAAMAEIRRLAGLQFDPQVVVALERLYARGLVAAD